MYNTRHSFDLSGLFFPDFCCFCFPHEAVAQYSQGVYRVANFKIEANNSNHENEHKPRILDLCFVENENHHFLAVIDADNFNVKIISILGDDEIDSKSSRVEGRPNRLSKLSKNRFVLIYENKLSIVLFTFESTKLRLDETIKVNDDVGSIKGIACFASNHFILTNGSSWSTCVEKKVTEINMKESDKMSFARRVTKPFDDEKYCFIADENVRRILWMDDSGTILYAQDKWNRNLPGVRGIAAGKNKTYAAVTNAISDFRYSKKGNEYIISDVNKRLIHFERPTTTIPLLLTLCENSLHLVRLSKEKITSRFTGYQMSDFTKCNDKPRYLTFSMINKPVKVGLCSQFRQHQL